MDERQAAPDNLRDHDGNSPVAAFLGLGDLDREQLVLFFDILGWQTLAVGAVADLATTQAKLVVIDPDTIGYEAPVQAATTLRDTIIAILSSTDASIAAHPAVRSNVRYLRKPVALIEVEGLIAEC